MSAVNCRGLDRHCQLQAPVKQDLEQQVHASAVGLHAVRVEAQLLLAQRVRGAQEVGHVRCVYLEDAEADIKASTFRGTLFPSLGSCATHSFFGDLCDCGWTTEALRESDGVLHNRLRGAV